MKLYLAPSWQAEAGKAEPPWLKGRRAERHARDISRIHAVVVHQTDVPGGFGAPSLEARALRYGGTSMDRRGTAYHYVISPRDNAVVGVRHPRVYTHHGDRSNAYSIGLAIDGRYPGDEVDPDQIAAGFVLVATHARAVGCPIDTIEAHAQHSAQRARDPGGSLWLPIERRAAVLGIFARPSHVTTSTRGGRGSPLREDWRPPELVRRIDAQPRPAVGPVAKLVALMHGRGSGGS